MKCSRKPFFIEGVRGNIFCNVFNTNVVTDTAVLVFSPFAEEMNKSRRMLAQQAAALANRGYPTLIFDYYGTGDSEGEFADATWDIWNEDGLIILNWLYGKGYRTINILAMRTGALLIQSLLSKSQSHIEKIILWQPVTNGELFLNQFLRLKTAAEIISNSGQQLNVKEIRSSLFSGEIVEIAGYEINPELALGLNNEKLNASNFNIKHMISWFELAASDGRTMPPASRRIIDEFKEAGFNIYERLITGPQFWSTVELVDVPVLLESTTTKLT